MHAKPIIEHPNLDHPVGPTPDLRRLLYPIGPAAVYAASNFPFAFSVAGGDTASALGTFAIVEGFDADLELIRHPLVAAGAFTGSTAGGRALFDQAAARAVPIPFYGELGSITPVFVITEPAHTRAQSIASEFVESFTLGAGQFCTKPGILVIPVGSTIPQLAISALGSVAPATMLTDGMTAALNMAENELAAHPEVSTLAPGGGTIAHAPSLYSVTASAAILDPAIILEERFGASAILVEYRNTQEAVAGARCFEGTLPSTIHGVAHTNELVPLLVPELIRRSGRLIWNQWPTGVAVSPAMQHGGP